MSNQSAMHGVMLAIYGIGVLLTGPSQSGKSELALKLIQRKHKLIADDYIILQKSHEKIIACCPPALEGFLAIRDIGIISVLQLFGQQAFCKRKELNLMVNLIPWNEGSWVKENEMPLQGLISMQTIMGIAIPAQTIHIAPHRDLAMLVETAAQKHKQKQAGHDAYADFIARQSSPLNYQS